MLRIILLVSILSVLHRQTECVNKLSVHILYESLCPDSIKFVNEQLYPVWRELSPYVNIYFVPFGKSKSLDHGTSFVCQHGPKECLGNKIQSCALNALIDQNTQVDYVHCFMNIFKKNEDINEMGQSCAEAVKLPWDYVLGCKNSPLGTQLQLTAETITAQYSPKFVPTILYDGHFHQQAQDDSLVNFRGVVCGFLQQRLPNACSSYTAIQI
ncbi:hypothetical protein FQA39_LY00491 [Lamprigera yunnana]|nr:hypothetical protein FQA39_LY00491 [Lamprigera yunnana]